MINQKELEKIYHLQREDFFYFGPLSIKDRIEILKKIKRLIQQKEEEIFKALKEDLNKDKVESFVSEIALIYKEIDLYVKNIKKWARSKRVKTPFYLFPSKSSYKYEAYGQTLIISPWNYPIMLSIVPIINSIGAGNRVILKPSEFSEYSSKWLMKFFNENFDHKIIYCADSSLETSNFLLDQKFDLVFFTGSTNVGKIVLEKTSKFLTPTILELGGKSPTIICSDVNLDNVIEKIYYGKSLNSGQTCTTHDYVLIDKKIEDEFIQKYREYVQNQLKNNLENEPKIISEKHYNRLLKLVISTELKTNHEMKIIEPFIYKASLNDAIMQEEIFGPILPVISFETIEEAIDIVKRQQKPLALYLFSKQKSIINKIKKLQAGAIIINNTTEHVANSYLPFGGIGNSGLGKYRGYSGFKSFSHQKSFFINKFVFKPLSLVKKPFNNKKFSLLKKIFK
ncbi:aldehyde dehydrogenase family protein [Mycoplasma sp. Z386]